MSAPAAIFSSHETLSRVAQLSPSQQTVAFGGGVVLMLLGAYLRWMLPEYRMAAEERTKEGRWTELEARRRVAWLRYSSPIVVLIGVGFFLTIFLE